MKLQTSNLGNGDVAIGPNQAAPAFLRKEAKGMQPTKKKVDEHKSGRTFTSNPRRCMQNKTQCWQETLAQSLKHWWKQPFPWSAALSAP